MKYFIGLFFILLFLSGCNSSTPDNAPEERRDITACNTSIDAEDDPATVAAWKQVKQETFPNIYVADEWENPELIEGDVNTIGWEDSAYISADGETLSFFYLRGDLLNIAGILKYYTPVDQGGLGGDPRQFSTYHRGPSRGVTPLYTSDSFHAQKIGDTFCNVEKFTYSKDGENEWGLMQAANGDWYSVSHTQDNMDLYKNGERLPIPGADQYKEDNPHSIETAYGKELFFDSLDDEKGDPTSRGGLWVTRYVDGAWTEPEALAPPLQFPADNQPFLTTEGTLYFTSARDSTLSVWKSTRTGKNSWTEPTKVIGPPKSPGYGVWGIGEATLPADGTWIYFVTVFENEKGEHDADVGRVKRK